MAVVLDTSAVLALFSRDDAMHARTAAWLETLDDDLITSPLAVAEMDLVLGRCAGPPAVAALWENLTSGAFAVRWWADALAETLAIARANAGIDLADASLVALAGRLRTDRVATHDLRRFRSLTTPDGAPFVVLPADAP